MLRKLNWIHRQVSNLVLKIEFCVHLEKLHIIHNMTTLFLSISHYMRQLTKVSIYVSDLSLCENQNVFGILNLILVLFWEISEELQSCHKLKPEKLAVVNVDVVYLTIFSTKWTWRGFCYLFAYVNLCF